MPKKKHAPKGGSYSGSEPKGLKQNTYEPRIDMKDRPPSVGKFLRNHTGGPDEWTKVPPPRRKK